MPPSTPDDGSFTELIGEPPTEDICLDDLDAPPGRPLPSYADGHDGRIWIYPHGYDLRLRLLVDRPQASVVLARCGWSAQADPKVWISRTSPNGTVYYGLRGGLSLGQRPPSNRKLPLAMQNRGWRTRLYAVSVEMTERDIFLDLKGTRLGDVRLFAEGVLGLGPGDYELAYVRILERYLVLSPPEAMRLAAALNQTPKTSANKQRLIVDLAVPLVVRRRSKRVAHLTMYRVTCGATAAFKLEVALKGRKRDRSFFTWADAKKLDAILLGLVREHGLHPIPKPQRWEPRINADLDESQMDQDMREIGHAAYRGRQVSAAKVRAAWKCHTPTGPECHEEPRFTASAKPSARTGGRLLDSNDSLSAITLLAPQGVEPEVVTGVEEAESSCLPAAPLLHLHGEDTAPCCYAPEGYEAPRLDAPARPSVLVAREVLKTRGVMAEVIFPHDLDPGPCVDAFLAEAQRLGRRPGVGLVAADGAGDPLTWGSAVKHWHLHPWTDDVDVVLLVVDTSAVAEWADAFCQGEEELNGAMVAGPFHPDPQPTGDGHIWDPGVASHARVMGHVLWDAFKLMRQACEAEGVSVVIFSVDMRPDHGKCPLYIEKKGGQRKLRASHLYTDARVRSSTGDAGRYWCHGRYLIEMGRTVRMEECGAIVKKKELRMVRRVVLAKDELEGRTGRVLYSAGRRRP